MLQFQYYAAILILYCYSSETAISIILILAFYCHSGIIAQDT